MTAPKDAARSETGAPGTLYALDTPETDAAARMHYGEKIYVDCAVSASLEIRLKKALNELTLRSGAGGMPPYPERYALKGSYDGSECGSYDMEPDKDGAYVDVADYHTLLARCEALAGELDTERDEVALKQACIKGMGEQAEKLAQRATEAEARASTVEQETIERCEDAMLGAFSDMSMAYLFTSGFDNRIIKARDAIRALKDKP